jgi:hypothetical protein
MAEDRAGRGRRQEEGIPVLLYEVDETAYRRVSRLARGARRPAGRNALVGSTFEILINRFDLIRA